MTAGPRGPTAGRDLAGPPAPDPLVRSRIEHWLRNRRLALKADFDSSAMSMGATVDVVMQLLEDLGEYGAAVPAPPAGLTVERLAALLREYGALVLRGREHDADQQAAWLLPRLASVSPGAPAAARRAPTDAMIDAAALAMFRIDKQADEPDWPESERTRAAYREYATIVLRAALAAQEQQP